MDENSQSQETTQSSLTNKVCINTKIKLQYILYYLYIFFIELFSKH